MTYRHDLVKGYQPHWTGNATEGTPLRPVEPRYSAIKDKLSRHEPGFTLLDLGAHSAYFSMRLADELGAEATAVDGNPDLKSVLEEHPHPRVRGVHQWADPELIRSLGPFDAGLCLSVLHHVPDPTGMLKALSEVCRTLFVEVALPEESSDADHARRISSTRRAVTARGGRVIAHTPTIDGRHRRPTYVITRKARR